MDLSISTGQKPRHFHAGVFIFLFFLSVFKPPIPWVGVNIFMVVLCMAAVLALLFTTAKRGLGINGAWQQYKIEWILAGGYALTLGISLLYNAGRYPDLAQFIYHGIAPVAIWCVFPISIILFSLPQAKQSGRLDISPMWGWGLFAVLAFIALWQKVAPESSTLLTQFFVAQDADFGYVNINSLMRINTDFGPLMAIALVAALSCVIYSGKSIWSKHNLILLALILPLLAAGGISGSRNFILSMGVGFIALMLPLARRHPGKVSLAALSALILFHVAIMQSQHTLAKFGSVMPYAYKLMQDKPLTEIEFEAADFKPNLALGGREDLWGRAIELWQTSPVLGVTGGGFKLASGEPNPLNNTHSYPIQILVDGGIIAAIFIILLLFQIQRRIRPSQYGVLAATAVSLTFDNYLDHSLPWILGVAWLIAVTGNGDGTAPGETPSGQSPQSTKEKV